jgi:hypothetical protein
MAFGKGIVEASLERVKQLAGCPDGVKASDTHPRRPLSGPQSSRYQTETLISRLDII